MAEPTLRRRLVRRTERSLSLRFGGDVMLGRRFYEPADHGQTWLRRTSGLRAHEPQAVADHTVTMIIAYLAGLAVIVLLWRVVDGFIRRPVERPLHRWVVVPVEPTEAQTDDVAEAAEQQPQIEADEVADDAWDADEAAPSRDREPVA